MSTDAPWENDAPATGAAKPASDAPWENDAAVETPKSGASLRDTILNAAETIGAPFAKFGEYGADAIRNPIDSAKGLGVGIAKGVADTATLADRAASRAGLYPQPPQMTPELDAAYEAAPPIAGVGRAAFPSLALGPASRLGAVGDVAVNAGYSAADAYAEGRDPRTAALYGGAGAAGGRALGRSLTADPRFPNSAPAGASEDVATLMRNGITPTPGQAGGRFAKFNEGTAADFLPGAGASIDAAKSRALGQYSAYETRTALDPMREAGIRADITSPAGRKAVAQANEIIDNSYASLAGRTFLPSDHARVAALRAGAELDRMPLSDAQKRALAGYVGQKVESLIKGAENGRISGEAAKAFDAELARLARSTQDGAMSDAYYALRGQMRSVLQGTDDAAVAQLRATDAAYRNMIPVNKAANSAIRKGGVFDPVQFNKAGGSGPVNEAALSVLGTASPSGLKSVIKRGGAFGAATLAHPVAGVAAYGAGRLGSMALYSEPMVKAMIASMNLKPSIRTWVNGLNAPGQREFVQRMLEEMSTQVGREVATEPQGN